MLKRRELEKAKKETLNRLDNLIKYELNDWSIPTIRTTDIFFSTVKVGTVTRTKKHFTLHIMYQVFQYKLNEAEKVKNRVRIEMLKSFMIEKQ